MKKTKTSMGSWVGVLLTPLLLGKKTLFSRGEEEEAKWGRCKLLLNHFFLTCFAFRGFFGQEENAVLSLVYCTCAGADPVWCCMLENNGIGLFTV